MARALGEGALLMQLLNNSPNTSYHLGPLRRHHPSNHAVLSCLAWREADEYSVVEILVKALNATEHIVLLSRVLERIARRCVSVKKSLPLASCTGWAGKTPAVRLWGLVLKKCKSAALFSCTGRFGLA